MSLGPLSCRTACTGCWLPDWMRWTHDARSLVADAAVLGTSFSAEALVAVSGRSEAEVQTCLAELVRREVLQVSADRLSPQRGDYRFAQEMLRQVAYATLARRDRKARHLAVAEYLALDIRRRWRGSDGHSGPALPRRAGSGTLRCRYGRIMRL